MLLDLVVALKRRGHDTRVVVPGVWALERAAIQAGVDVTRLPLRMCWLVQQQSQPLPFQLTRWLRYITPDPRSVSLRRWLRSTRPDVVHVNCLPHLRGPQIAASLGFPVLWHLHEILPAGWRRRWFASRLERYATSIVAVSEAVAGWLREEGLGDLVEVVHNGVEVPPGVRQPAMARRRLGLPEETVLVGCFGQLIAHKGVLDLVAAAARLEAGVEVVLAGSGKRRFVDELQAAIGRGPGVGRVRLLPPQPDAWDLLAAVDVVVVPSRWPDPLPRAVLEAMAVGRPVVASDSGGNPEMVIDGETGFLVPPGDIDALALRLRRLSDDRNLRRRMGEAGSVRARTEFSLARHVERMEDILQATADGVRHTS